MEKDFWLKIWEENKIGFHQSLVNSQLEKHFSKLNLKEGAKTLVPLCGKSLDMIWLLEKGLNILGVELSPKAVNSFFSENKIEDFTKTEIENFTQYQKANLTINLGDVTKLNKSNYFDFIYDRAALVALPPHLRKEYAQVLTESLKPQGKYLLIVFERDPKDELGPPFSIPSKEISRLYENNFKITLVGEELAKPNEEGNLTKEKVYLLEKL